MDLDDFEGEIRSREDFLQFLQRLHQDFKKHGETWENNRLDLFIEALHAYASDLDGFDRGTGQRIDLDGPQWQFFADTLAGARVYE